MTKTERGVMSNIHLYGLILSLDGRIKEVLEKVMADGKAEPNRMNRDDVAERAEAGR